MECRHSWLSDFCLSRQRVQNKKDKQTKIFLCDPFFGVLCNIYLYTLSLCLMLNAKRDYILEV